MELRVCDWEAVAVRLELCESDAVCETLGDAVWLDVNVPLGVCVWVADALCVIVGLKDDDGVTVTEPDWVSDGVCVCEVVEVTDADPVTDALEVGELVVVRVGVTVELTERLLVLLGEELAEADELAVCDVGDCPPERRQRSAIVIDTMKACGMPT